MPIIFYFEKTIKYNIKKLESETYGYRRQYKIRSKKWDFGLK